MIRTPRTPSYRLHRPTGQAVVTLNGRDIYLGRHGTPASMAEYDRLISEWLARGRQPATAVGEAPADLTVTEMAAGYLRHADGYYLKDGRPTSEVTLIELAMKVLRHLYGHTPAKDFGPLALKAVRQAFIGSGLCRTEVNRRTSLVVRSFRWASENELVPPATYHGLKSVPWLRKGRSAVREAEPVRPVPEASVDAIRPHVAPQVWAMVELQRLTGMRPGEVVSMRSRDIDVTGRVWIYRPESHKTEHHGRERIIHLGPRAQAVLRPWLRPDLAAFLFSPAEAEDARHVEQRRNRKSPVQPSQRNRRKARPICFPGDHYTAETYRRAVARGCDKAFPHPVLSGIKRKDLTAEQREQLKGWRKHNRWHPGQLRHNAATRLRKEFGLDTSRAVLGHSDAGITTVYAERDAALAAAAMERVG